MTLRIYKKYDPAKARNRQREAENKHARRAITIGPKYFPLVLTETQKVRVVLMCESPNREVMDSHQVACRLGLTHSAVADYMNQTGAGQK